MRYTFAAALCLFTSLTGSSLAYAQETTPPADGQTLVTIATRQSPDLASVVTGGVTSTTGPQTAFAARYASLTASLISSYSSQGATTADLAAMLGISDLSVLSADAGVIGEKFGDGSFQDIYLNQSGVGGIVAITGSSWANQLAQARSGMTLPDGSALDFSASSRVLGTLLAGATSTMAASFPSFNFDLSAAPGAAWESALAKTAKDAATPGKVSGLDACAAAMLQVAGTGKAATSFKGCGAGLSACVATGAYFHDKLVGDVATSGVLPPSDFNQLQPWQREALSKASPTAAGALKGTTTGCGATAAVAKTVNTSVPGTWGSLGATNNSASQSNIPSGWGGLGN